MNSFTPGDKLRRLIALVDKPARVFDEVTGSKTGRTQSYVRVPSKATPPREYLRLVIEAFKSIVPELTVEWFFDGVDSYPPGFTVPNRTMNGESFPMYGGIPSDGDDGAATQYYKTSLIESLPRDSYWCTVSETGELLRRGDRVLIVPSESALPDTIHRVRLPSGRTELFTMRRAPGGFEPVPVFSGQSKPVEFQIIGYVVEVRRDVVGGAISFASFMGIVPDMLKAI